MECSGTQEMLKPAEKDVVFIRFPECRTSAKIGYITRKKAKYI